jgi:hypothetical protein
MCITVLAAAFMLVGTHTVLQLATADGLLPPVGSSAGLLLLGEIFAVGAALLTPALVKRTDRLAGAAALVAAVLLFGMLTASGSTLRILMLWNMGLGGWLPNVMYSASAAALTYTLLAAWRAQKHDLALGILLLASGGLGLHSTYQSGLAIAGFTVLALAAATPSTSTQTQDRGRSLLARQDAPPRAAFRLSSAPSAGHRAIRATPPRSRQASDVGC